MRFVPRSEGVNCMIELQGSGYEDEDRTSFIKVNGQEVRTFRQGVQPFLYSMDRRYVHSTRGFLLYYSQWTGGMYIQPGGSPFTIVNEQEVRTFNQGVPPLL